MLNRIFFAFQTLRVRHAGTNSNPVLILGDYNRDRLQHTFSNDVRIDEGSSRLFEVDVADRNLQAYFPIIRVGLRGADAWWPGTVFVFGESNGPNELNFVPIGIRTWVGDQLSTDESEGLFSMPLYRANITGNYAPMKRLLLLIQTADEHHAGTRDTVQIKVEFANQHPAVFRLEKEQLAGRGAVHLEMKWLQDRFKSSDVRRVTVRVEGNDQWTPQRFFLYGVDDRANDYENMVPLVNIGDWGATGLGKMSADPNEGASELDLYRAYF